MYANYRAYAAFAASLALAICFSVCSSHGAPPIAKPPKYYAENPLKAGFVFSITADRRGGLWIATEERGVIRFDPAAAPEQRWAEFREEQGLGDNSAFALTCDKRGRIWVGTVNHGVAVFNGKSWKTYSRITGPLGERVFALACSPKDGDVWIGTNAGLSRYSVGKDSWRYYTRQEGLPSDQVSAIAFDSTGRICIGTQCDGIAIAEATDDYASWKVTQGPDNLVESAVGEGLPSNLINAVLIAEDHSIYIATSGGLAKSKDGIHWNYIRGSEYADKIKNSTKGIPANWKPASSDIAKTLLPEDFITSLKEGDDGLIWLTFRKKGIAVFDPVVDQLTYKDPKAGECVRAILPDYQGQICLGDYGKGFSMVPRPPELKSPISKIATQPVESAAEVPFPSEATPPSARDVEALLVKAKAAPAMEGKVIFLGDDWTTQGDWLGRYGRQIATMCAMAAPLDQYLGYGPDFRISHVMGPHHKDDDGIRHWCHWRTTHDKRCLYTQVSGCRRQAEWDDHGEAYSSSWEGPDVWIGIEVPEGVFRLSFYFVNKDGHGRSERFRDHLLEIRSFNENLEQDFKPYTPQLMRAEAAPVLARARVQDFWTGVYKQFLVRGKGFYLLKISRNYSFNTTVSSVMIDQMHGYFNDPRRGSDPEKCWIPWMGSTGATWRPEDQINFCRPDMPELKSGTIPSEVSNAVSLTRFLDQSYNNSALWWNQSAYRLFAYRAARKSTDNQDLLGNMEWRLFLWTEKDRTLFTQTMARAWKLELQSRQPEPPQTK